MKHIKEYEEEDVRDLINKKGKDIEGYHGSSKLITDFRFPLFLSTSKSRATSFAVHMKWNEKLGKNTYTSLKGDETGYLYHIQVENAKLLPWKGGPKDEMLIESGDIKILKVEKVGVKKVLNQYLPYIV